jgi:hypothetical protein
MAIASERGPTESDTNLYVPAAPRRHWIGWVVVVALAGGAVFVFLQYGTSTSPATATTVPVAKNFADVVQTDLIQTSQYDGTLGRQQGDPISLRLGGTVTRLPAEGTTLNQGDVVAWVDNQPVVLLSGDIPAWRTMTVDSQGPDVAQLETDLTALGFNANESKMTVDDAYTNATKSVVENWQRSIGANDDGVVDFGEVIFGPGPVRIDSLQVNVGDQIGAGTPIFTTSSDMVDVTFGLPTSEQGKVELGSSVTITLPDLRTTTGKVKDIATVATRPSDGSEATFDVTVALDDASVASGIDEAPVTVDVVTDSAKGVVVVPVESLLALREGGYAVEVQQGSGTKLVAVTPGFYAGGKIAVTGEVKAGDKVVVP